MNMRKIIAMLAAVLMLCSIIPMGAMVSAAEEVAYLANFENNSLGGWKNDAGGMSVVSTSELPVANAATGNYVVKKVKPAGDWGFLEDRSGFTVEPNTDYMVTVDVMTVATQDYPIQAFVSTGTWITGTLGTTGAVKCPNNQWTTLSFTFNSGENTKVFASIKSTWDNCTYYFDNFKVAKLDPYRDVTNNGGFETGDLTGWNKHENVTVEAGAAHDGNYGAHLTDRGTWGGILDQTVSVEAGKTYEVSFWIKVNKFGINLQIKDGSSSGASLASGSTWFPVSTHSNWTLKTYTVTPTTNAIFFNFCGGGNGTPDASKETDTYVDSFTVKAVKDPSFDGYVYNGDFETGNGNYWTLHQSTAISADAAHNGDYGMHIVGVGNWGGLLEQDISGLVVGNKYLFSFWMKMNHQGVNVKIGDTYVGWYSSVGDWTLVTKEFTATATTAKILINGGGDGTANPDLAADLYVDDFSVIELKDPSFDGYIYNGDFECGSATKWSVNSYSYVAKEAAKDGNFGIVSKNPAGAENWGGTFNQSFTAVVGAQYKIALDYKAVSKGVNLQFAGATKNDGTTWLSATSWTHNEVIFTATAETVKLNFCGGGTTAEEIVYLDNIVVTLVSLPHTHEYVGVETKAPTCGEAGEMTYSCTCGEGTYTEAIPATGEHVYFDDCSAICEACGYEREASHNVVHVEAVEATCNALGNIEYWYCDACGMAWLDEACTLNTNQMAVKLPMSEEHTYANEYDVDCDVCGAVREVTLPIVGAGTSVSEDVSGVAVRFNVAVEGLTVVEGTGNEANYDNATIGGYKLISMGVVATNQWSHLDIPCVYLCDLEADSAAYATRIINIPPEFADSEITFQSYFIVEIDGVATAVDGEYVTASYNSASN